MTVDQYKDHMVEQANLYIEASALVSPVDGEPDSKQDCLKAHDFRFRRPDLDLDVSIDRMQVLYIFMVLR